jgi:hypothetical protein
VEQHFVAAYEQKGDFEVVRVNDKIQKNGGNVVTYFCTPDMRVVHFVVGPVSAGQLLDEAAWAHRVFEDVKNRSIDELTKPQAEALARQQTDAVRREHIAMLGDQAGRILREAAINRAADKRSSAGSYYRAAAYGGESKKKARLARWASLIWSVGGNKEERAHRVLAIDPMPPLVEIDSTVFQSLAGERVNDRDGSIERTMGKVTQAGKDGRAVLFVFYRSWGHGKPAYLKGLYGNQSWRKLLRQFEIVELPLKELPALSAQMPEFELPVVAESATVQFVFMNCRQNQISAIADPLQHRALGAAFHHAIARNQISFAKRLIEEDRVADAKRVLYRTRRSADRDSGMHAAALLAALRAE